MNIGGCDPAELFGAFSIKPQMNDPALLFIRRGRARNVLTGKIGFLFYKQPFFNRFLALALHLVAFDAVFGRNHVLTSIDSFQFFAIVGIDQAELEFRHA